MLRLDVLKRVALGCGLMMAINVHADTAPPIVDPQVQLLNEQIVLLQNMYAPTTVKALVNTYAAAVQQRNGAVQYSLLCPDLQAQRLSGLEENHWATGESSPSVSAYAIQYVGPNQYTITYTMSLQGQASGHVEIENIGVMTVKPDPDAIQTQHYCIHQDKVSPEGEI